MKRSMLYVPYLTLAAAVAVVVAANLPFGSEAGRSRTDSAMPPMNVQKPQGEQPGRLVDVVCHMEVNPGWRIASVYEGRTYHFCTSQCKARFDADPQRYLQTRCIVCKRALADDRSFPATYLGHTYYLCSAEHRAKFKQDPAAYFMHTMWGIPSWLYYASIAIVLLVSFGVFEWLGRVRPSAATTTNRAEDPTASDPDAPQTPQGASPRRAPRVFVGGEIRGEGERLLGELGTGPGADLALPIVTADATKRAPASDRFDLLAISWIAAAARSRVFRFALRAVFVAAFVLIIAAGLFGNQNPALNIAPILTWTIWWGMLIVLILFAGKAWCYVCPWDAMAEWTEKLALWRKREDGLSAALKWPRVVRNISIATFLFIGLTWIELGFGVTTRPRVTAYLAIAMLLMAVVSALLFDRKSFCRYGCLVGRVSGLYALFASVEVRARSARTCAKCRGKECVTGSDTAYGCPTFLYPGKLQTNTYCIQCMECVQACPHDNLAVNLRPWGSDLTTFEKPRTDEAYLALLMLAITGFHGLTMTPAWKQLIDAVRSAGGLGRIVGFSVGMGLLMVGPIVIYALLVAVSMWLGRGRATTPLRYRDLFIRYAYALLPIALFYHIAHNLEHLLMEGPKVMAMVSDPFGWRWNLFGTAGWVIPPMISLDKLWLLQAGLVLIGHVYSLWVAQRTSLRLFGSSRAAFRSQLPMLAAMIAFSVFSLWLLKQPMEMRTSAM